ncbi:Ketohexokinase [Glycine max]|nr:Ketohexokinase [Glycine max]
MPNLCTVSSNASSNFIFGVQPHNFYNVFGSRRTRPRCRVSMSSSDPQNAVVVGCGSVTMDFLATVAAYPKPDDKIRSTSLKVQGGGNVGNALTCLARLGLNPRLISKVSKEGTSPFTYIIVDNQTKTRTCIHTAGYPPMIPDELSKSSLLSALDGAKFAYFDGRLPDTALVVAQELLLQAVRKNIPILIDAERPREGLDDLLKLADYVVCSAKFPASWTKASTVPQALVSMLLRLPNIKFVIVTLGKDGCIMLERSVDGPSTEEVDVDSLLESLEIKRDKSVSIPTCISSVMSAKPKILFLLSVAKLKAEGIGTVSGKLYVGTAESIPPSELVDTTGAGDAFIGAVIYAICAKFTPETMLSFAANVAGAKCRDLGARSGLPYRADPRIASFVLEKLSSSA